MATYESPNRPWLVLGNLCRDAFGETIDALADNDETGARPRLKGFAGDQRDWCLIDGDLSLEQVQSAAHDDATVVRAPIGRYADGTEGAVIVSARGWRYA